MRFITICLLLLSCRPVAAADDSIEFCLSELAEISRRLLAVQKIMQQLQHAQAPGLPVTELGEPMPGETFSAWVDRELKSRGWKREDLIGYQGIGPTLFQRLVQILDACSPEASDPVAAELTFRPAGAFKQKLRIIFKLNVPRPENQSP